MIYFDAAYVAKCYLNEPGAEKVRALAGSAAGIASCELARVEMFSLVQRRVGMGHLSAAEVGDVIADFEADERTGVWNWLPVTPRLIRDVCRRVRTLPDEARIRALDAVHLGCAMSNGFAEVWTNDRHMLLCAGYFGVTAKDVLAR